MLLALAATLILLQAAPADPRGGELWEAARLGNFEEVRHLLDDGVSPDAPNPQGALPLSAAASAGSLEVVRLLVEKGARIDSRDPFFNSSALESAVFNKRSSVVRFLLEKGATDADSALDDAVERGDLDQARAALATGKIERLDLLAARKQAEGKPSAEMKALLATANAAVRPRKPYTVASERLRKLAGRYRGRAGEATVAISGSGLELQLAGQPNVALVAVAEDRFENADGERGGRLRRTRGPRRRHERQPRRRRPALLGRCRFRSDALADGCLRGRGPAPRSAPRPWPQFRGERVGHRRRPGRPSPGTSRSGRTSGSRRRSPASR